MKLNDWKNWKGYKLDKAAEVLGISPSYLSLILSGDRRGSPEIALQIEKRTDGAVKKEEIMWPE